jgi:hypothetical protein
MRPRRVVWQVIPYTGIDPVIGRQGQDPARRLATMTDQREWPDPGWLIQVE